MSDRGARAMVETTDRASERARRVDHTRSQLSEISPTDVNRTHRVASATQTNGDIDDIDTARMEEYGLLAVLLRRAPDSALLTGLSEICGNSTPLGIAHASLAQAAVETDPERLEREFFELFIGVGRGDLLPYGSYYLTGFLNERPLARLRSDLHMLGIVRTEQENEPEDHAAILCEIMAGLAGGGLAAAPDAQNKLFTKHLAPWIGRFFTDLAQVKNSKFYRCVGIIGGLFIEIETEAFALRS